MTTRCDKTTQDPQYPNHASTPQEGDESPTQEETVGPTMAHQQIIDTNFLHFPIRPRKSTMDEQFAFVLSR